MKIKLFLLTMLLFDLMGYSQNTYVPDDNFEQALIDLGYDSGPLDNYVSTANISTVITLNVENSDISDLTGIEGFINLEELRCFHNPYTSLDFSNNTALTYLSCGGDFLTSINVTQNTALTFLQCFGAWSPVLGGITNLDVSNNIALATLDCQAFIDLTSLDLSNNIALTSLTCGFNGLTSLDLSQNTVLEYLDCQNNALTSLNVKNGNNINFSGFNATFNGSLFCINVDDVAWCTTNWINIWAQSYFSEDCSLGIEDFDNNAIKIFPNPVKDMITVYSREKATFSVVDIKGQNILNEKLTQGENRLDLSNLTSGLYFIKIKMNNRENIIKVVKQ